VPGDARVHHSKGVRALGLAQLSPASPAVTRAATGFPAGGVAPVGHKSPLPVVMDAEVLRHAVVYGGGGDDRHMLRISPDEIQRLTGAVVADVTARAGEGEEARP
jgi:prolyl-tRNA editing enzyme YbaK/EbsC (Cys-tRNA(Pro) deacylase)